MKKQKLSQFQLTLLFFDKFEDRVRGWLSRRPILYAFIGGTGVIIFWRGIWHLMDYLVEYNTSASLVGRSADIGALIWWDGPLSILIGLVLLLVTGIFTSTFIGNEIIISGIRGEKKTVDKTELEIKNETASLKDIKRELRKMTKLIDTSRK